MIRIVSYKVPKNNAVIVGGGGYASQSTPSGTGSLETHTLWGQEFDGTNDVNGDMTGVGSITASGDITTTGDIIVDGCVKSNCYSGGNATFSAMSANTANITGLTATTGHLSGLTANTGFFTDLTASTATTTALTTNTVAAGSGNVGTLLATNITADYLTVTHAATFFKLIIDEIKSTQGQLVISPANAVLDRVDAITGGWRCYFKCKDTTGKQIENTFEVNDQVVCQTFNVATGTSYNTSNTFYWRLCTATGTSAVTIDGQEQDCHYIDLSSSDQSQYSNSAPQVGDNVVGLGNRTDTARQAAIVLSAHNSQWLDAGLSAPSIVQYAGINDYNLSTHRLNIISNGYNLFKGGFTDNNGNDLSQMANSALSQANSAVTQATNATNAVNGISATVSSHTESISQLEQTATALTSTVSGHTEAIGNLNQEVSGMSGTVTANTESISVLQNTMNGLTSTVSGHTQSITNLNNDVSSISGSVTSNTQSISTLSNTVNGLNSTVSGHTQSITTINNEIDGISGSVTSNTQSISTLTNTLNGLSSTVSGHTTTINSLSGDVSNLSDDVSGLGDDVSGLDSAVSNLSGDVTANTASISTINQTMSGIQSTVESISSTTKNAWAMPLQGWQTYALGDTADAILYNSDRTAVRDDENDLYSPVVFIPSGQTATFELETENMDNRYWNWCWGEDVELSAGAYYNQNRQQMSFTDQGATTGNRRKYTATFTPSSDVYMTVNYAEQYWVYNPKLYLTSTGLASKSEINQSANSLGFYLYDQLYSTGIKITNHTIKLQGDKVTFTNSAGTVRDKIWIDPTDGTLHAVNGDFTGVVKASVMYSPVDYSASDTVTIAPSVSSPTNYYCIPATYGVTYVLPDPDDYEGLEVKIFAQYGTRQTGTAWVRRGDNNNIYFAEYSRVTINGTDYNLPKAGNINMDSSAKVYLQHNQLVTFKAMNSEWFVVSGIVYPTI